MHSLTFYAVLAFSFTLWSGFARANSDDAASVRQAVTQHLKALRSGDVDAIAKTLHPANADEAVLLRLAGEYELANERYERSLHVAFGGADHAMPLDEKNGTAADQAKVAITGETASAEFSPGVVLSLTRTTDGWRIPVAKVLHRRSAVPSDEPLRRYSEMTQALVALAEEVKAGRYKSAAEAKAAMTQRLSDVADGRTAQ